MMTIHFKNGTTTEVLQEVGEVIKKNVLREKGAAKFQCFSDENDKLFLIINLEEVVLIKSKPTKL